jgi:hypothetical protein
MKHRLAVLAGVALVGAAWVSLAAADVGLILRKAVMSVGDPMTVWGSCYRMPVYLVKNAYAKRARIYEDTPAVARPPTSRAFRLLGRMVCAGRMHYVGHYPDGDWSSWNGYLRFRVPRVAPGAYQLVVFCDPCQRGRGGTLIINNWLWRGSRRVGATALSIQP